MASFAMSTTLTAMKERVAPNATNPSITRELKLNLAIFFSRGQAVAHSMHGFEHFCAERPVDGGA